MSTFAYDFFVSRRGSAAAVAQEVAQVLQSASYKVVVQDFDFVPGTNVGEAMHDALEKGRHLIVILTEDYDKSPFTRAEFTNFFALAARARGQRRLIVIRVEDVAPPGLLAAIIYADLVGVMAPERRREIILAAAEGRSTGERAGYQVIRGIPPRNPDFTGRDHLLDELHRRLNDADPPTAITQAAVHGLGGIGKTSLATEYAYRYRNEYAGIWWAAAENRAVLMASLASLAAILDAELAQTPNVEEAAKSGLIKLASGPRPWLLIYDNVPTPEDIRGLVPSVGARVIITSRWPSWSGRAAEIEVDVLDPKSAVDFLLKTTDRTDADRAGRLARALGYLPLALDHAAAYIRTTGLDFDRYLERLEDLIAKNPKGSTYPTSVAATFELALKKAGRDGLAELLLGVLSVLAPERIPLNLLDPSALPKEFRWLVSADRIDASLAALATVSLIKYSAYADGTPALTVHRLVQTTTRARLARHHRILMFVLVSLLSLLPRVKSVHMGPRNFLGTSILGAIALLAAVFPVGATRKPESWPLCERLLPHVLALLQQVREIGVRSPHLSTLLASASDFLGGRAAYEDAERLARQAVAMAEETVGRTHPAYADRLVTLASLLDDTGQYTEAERLLREAIAFGDKHLSPNDLRYQTWLNNLAALLADTNRRAEAEAIYRETISLKEKVLGRDNPSVGIGLINLAGILGDTDRSEEAEALFREAIAIGEKTLGRKHPLFATWLNNFGGLLAETGRVAEAESLFREALTINKAAYGLEHPAVGTCLVRLAGVLSERGEKAEAEALYP